MYDKSGDGRITFDEFVDIVADLGFPINGESFFDRSNVEVIVEETVQEEKKAEDVLLDDGYVHKTILLSTIVDEDLKKALAPFDTKGNGIIDLGKVQQAAKGNTPPKLHWSENHLHVGLADHVRSVNHIAILVSDVAVSTRFYRNIIGLEQVGIDRNLCLLY